MGESPSLCLIDVIIIGQKVASPGRAPWLLYFLLKELLVKMNRALKVKEPEPFYDVCTSGVRLQTEKESF